MRHECVCVFVCVCEGEGERELIALHVLLRYHKSKLTDSHSARRCSEAYLDL